MLQSLPHELFCQISQHLTTRDIVAFSMTCKSVNTAITENLDSIMKNKGAYFTPKWPEKLSNNLFNYKVVFEDICLPTEILDASYNKSLDIDTEKLEIAPNSPRIYGLYTHFSKKISCIYGIHFDYYFTDIHLGLRYSPLEHLKVYGQIYTWEACYGETKVIRPIINQNNSIHLPGYLDVKVVNRFGGSSDVFIHHINQHNIERCLEQMLQTGGTIHELLVQNFTPYIIWAIPKVRIEAIEVNNSDIDNIGFLYGIPEVKLKNCWRLTDISPLRKAVKLELIECHKIEKLIADPNAYYINVDKCSRITCDIRFKYLSKLKVNSAPKLIVRYDFCELLDIDAEWAFIAQMKQTNYVCLNSNTSMAKIIWQSKVKNLRIIDLVIEPKYLEFVERLECEFDAFEFPDLSCARNLKFLKIINNSTERIEIDIDLERIMALGKYEFNRLPAILQCDNDIEYDVDNLLIDRRLEDVFICRNNSSWLFDI